MPAREPDRYAVMGNPIGHSKSPQIHAAFARQTGEDLLYTALLVEPGRFSEAVWAFRDAGGKGLNVTVPFKEEAWALAAQRSPRAQRARAANTLKFLPDGECYGDNTDGVGLVRDLVVNHRAIVRDRRVLLLGAGGAARGVLDPLLAEAPAALVIANRTAQRALALAATFRDLGEVQGCGLSDLSGAHFDLVINATAASLHGEVPSLPQDLLAPGAWCYDLMYAAQPTPFLLWARSHGAGHAVDGLGMLVEQAAESFLLWRGVRPATAALIEALRASLSG